MTSCAICDKPALFRCGKCKAVRYCSRDCQKDHWPHHKRQCPQLAAALRDGLGSPPKPGGATPIAVQPAPSDESGHVPTQSTALPPAAPPSVAQPPAEFEVSPPPQPQPSGRPPPPSPPSPPPPHPQPPAVSRSARSGSLGANPRSARLLGESLPGRAHGTVVLPAPDLSFDAAAPSGSLEILPPATTEPAAAHTAGGGPNARVEPGPSGDSSALAVPASSPCPRRPQPPLAPRPPSAALSALYPAGPSSAAVSGRMRLGRAHLRDGGGLSGGLLAEGLGLTSVGAGPGGVENDGGASILDRILPPSARPVQPAAPPQPTPSPPLQWQQQVEEPQQAGAAPIASSEGVPSDASAVEAVPLAAWPPSSALPPWPWARGGGGSCRTGGDATSLADLPPEVLLEVLKTLPARSLAAASSVCRSWRRAAREPWLWVRQLCAAGYSFPAAALVAAAAAAAQRPVACAAVVGAEYVQAAAEPTSASSGGAAAAARAVPGVRGIRAVRAVRAAGGSSHDDFLGGLRVGFLDRLQQQAASVGAGAGGPPSAQPEQPVSLQHLSPPAGVPLHSSAAADFQPPPHGGLDLKALYGRTVRTESNWRTARYAESVLREHSSNVECLAFQTVEPWGSVLLSAAWDGSVRVFSLGPGGPGWHGGCHGGVGAGGAGGAPQQVRCVRRYRGHTGWITCMAAGRHQVVTASTDRRVAAWRYYSESSDPWVTLEHPQEVTLVRFCYMAQPPIAAATAAPSYLSHHLCLCGHGHDPGLGAEGAAGADPHRASHGSAWGGAGRVPAGPGLYGYPAGLGEVLLQGPGPPGAAATDGGWRLQGRGGDGGREAANGTHGPGSSPFGNAHSAREAAPSRTLPYNPQWEDWIVTGCIDGVLRLWHLPTKQLLRVFVGHIDVVWGISVLYDSSIMVSSSRDGNSKLWQLPRFSQVQAAVAAATTVVPQTLEAVATLCGHSAAILCMDTHRVPPGVVPPAPPPPPGSSASGGGGGGGGGSVVRTASDAAGLAVRPDELVAAHTDMVGILAHLLNRGLLSEVPGAGAGANAGGAGSDEQGAEEVSLEDKAIAAAAAAAGALPVWLVATGGADAVVRVWDLGSAQCLSTLRGHTVGVLSVQFGYLPRHGEALRDQQLLPPDLDVSAAAPPPPLAAELALPPGQYGSGYSGGGRAQRLPPTQQLVLVTGSVREVRVWDPVAGTALAKLDDHIGPVTSIALVHGMLVTLAMNDGLIVYKCNGLADPDEKVDKGSASGGSSRGLEAMQGRPAGLVTDEPALGANRIGVGGGGGAGGAERRLHGAVAAKKSPLEPVICMQDSSHHAFAAALAVQLEGLAVGSGTGDINYLDFRPRASPLPSLMPGRRQ